MSKAYLSIQNLSQWYPVKGNNILFKTNSYVKAVDDVSLQLKKGEILGIIGESGCGKSTLGRMLVHLEAPFKGDVLVEGQSMTALIKKDVRAFRRMVQIVFQNPYDAFTPRDTIEKIMIRPLRIHNIGKDDSVRRQMIVDALEKGGLLPAQDILKRYPHQLSGGQLQRISIIRAMLLSPKIIVADEPVSMLDVSVRAEIINMLLTLTEQNQTSVVFISHDIALTRYVSNNIAVMYLGKIVEYGSTEDVIYNPQHPYTKVLISNCGTMETATQNRKIKVEGEPPTPIDPGPGCYFAPRCYMADDTCFKVYPKVQNLSDTHCATCHKLNTKGEPQ